jgi:hypothetical protein
VPSVNESPMTATRGPFGAAFHNESVGLICMQPHQTAAENSNVIRRRALEPKVTGTKYVEPSAAVVNVAPVPNELAVRAHANRSAGAFQVDLKRCSVVHEVNGATRRGGVRNRDARCLDKSVIGKHRSRDGPATGATVQVTRVEKCSRRSSVCNRLDKNTACDAARCRRRANVGGDAITTST